MFEWWFSAAAPFATGRLVAARASRAASSIALMPHALRDASDAEMFSRARSLSNVFGEALGEG